jgi:hypothetical protein
MGHGVFAEEQIGGPEFPAGAAKILEMIHRAYLGRNRRSGKSAFPKRKELNRRRIIS